MELSASGVVRDHLEIDNTVLVSSFTNEQRQVLTFIPHSVVDAYFEGGFTTEQCNDLIHANLPAVEEIISKKYAGGAIAVYTGAGLSFPRVDITLADLRRASAKLSTGMLIIKDFQGKF